MHVMNNEELTHKSLTETAALALSKHGDVYFGHLDRVRRYFLELVALLPDGLLTPKEGDDGQTLSLLHDIVEDGLLTYDDLRALAYSEREIELIASLTRDPANEVYIDKIRAIAGSGDLIRILVKLCDNRDNSTPERIAALPVERRSLINRYRKARRVLFDGLATNLRHRCVSEEVINTIEQWLGNKDTGSW